MAAFMSSSGEYLPEPTFREIECIEHVADGMTQEEVARALGITKKTVKSHLYGLYRRMDAQNAAQAYKICVQKGYINPCQP